MATEVEEYRERGQAMLDQATKIERALARTPDGPTREEVLEIGPIIQARLRSNEPVKAALDAIGFDWEHGQGGAAED